MNTDTKTPPRRPTDREIKIMRESFLELYYAEKNDDASKLLLKINQRMPFTAKRVFKELRTKSLYIADFLLLDKIFLDAEFEKPITAETIHTQACEIYNELLTPPKWYYGETFTHLLESDYCLRTERYLMEKFFPKRNAFVDYRAAREHIAPDEFININEKTEAILQEQSKRTGRTRTDIMNRLLEIAAAAGLAEQIPPATEAPAKQTP